ncbi:hypothetical protein PTTG_04270 [Puccinia triticina 1-1 BBBD Race 1]|uniref:Uncharacterized protein n=2 Tax=Puccinia triticina TaxID=208348 RepID=A0A0C4ETZ1_PUCT1|nr:uncharacterized protein PtA15_1A195 [Puccinia triticina]OAV91570.1 hypothetical protein PTTG_04270 [Puccinia triticina 1-1 BBBD Race 1]WAQ80857.1 hypothetical protein PtA15_1A195 [Puccinia triticina]WAR51750.1 hypothetical protein PtB15_1B186 [Puccinia triticina]
MAQSNQTRLEIKYDLFLCDKFLRLAAPEKIPAEWPQDPLAFMLVAKESCSLVWFKAKVLLHLDLLRDDFKLGGILNNEDALHRLEWVGQIIKPSGITMYSFPSGYAAFRRILFNMRGATRAGLGTTQSESEMPLDESSHWHSLDPGTPPRPMEDEDFASPESENDSDADNSTKILRNAFLTAPAEEGSLAPAQEGSLLVGYITPQEIPPAKRQCLHQADFNLTMKEFFLIAHLRPDDKHTLSVIKKNLFYHWSAFKGLTKDDLVEAGFKVGPAQLIVSGVASAVSQLELL